MAQDLALLADIGGTNTRLALAMDGVLQPNTIMRFKNAGEPGLDPIVAAYLEAQAKPSLDGVCVAMAGPVRDGVGAMTNLSWELRTQDLRAQTGAAKAAILNDLQAQAYALPFVTSDHLETVIAADKGAGPSLVLGVGTGFNAACLVPTLHGNAVVPASESGHATLPVRSELDWKISQFVAKHHGFAAVEDVLSGRGLERVYTCLSGQDLSAAEIMAQVESDDMAAAALTQFIRTLGTVAGDLSLIHMPFGGVYLVGGVARAVAPYLASHGFQTAMRDKGRFDTFIDQFAVHVVVDDYAALTGCAAFLDQAP